MSTTYTIRTYTSAGEPTHVLTDFLGLAYSRRVNEVGSCQFVLAGEHAAVDNLDPDDGPLVGVWRRDSQASGGWRVEFAGRVRGREQSTDESGVGRCTVTAIDGIGLLAMATSGYYARKGGQTYWPSSPAETVAKQLVQFNLTSSGTVSSGRRTAVTLSGVSIEADGAGGTVITFSCAWQNVLDALRSVSALGNGDFDMVRTAPGAWEFRWYDGQRGSDKRASVVFALNYGNMARPRLVQNSMNEATVAIVGGQGEEGARTVVVVFGPNYRPNTNAGEIFVNASHLGTTSELIATGQARLNAIRATQDLDFEAIQTPGSRYVEHYDLGDLVTARYRSYSTTKKIVGVNVELNNSGDERIAIDTSTVEMIFHLAVSDAVTVGEAKSVTL